MTRAVVILEKVFFSWIAYIIGGSALIYTNWPVDSAWHLLGVITGVILILIGIAMGFASIVRRIYG